MHTLLALCAFGSMCVLTYQGSATVPELLLAGMICFAIWVGSDTYHLFKSQERRSANGKLEKKPGNDKSGSTR